MKKICLAAVLVLVTQTFAFAQHTPALPEEISVESANEREVKFKITFDSEPWEQDTVIFQGSLRSLCEYRTGRRASNSLSVGLDGRSAVMTVRVSGSIDGNKLVRMKKVSRRGDTFTAEVEFDGDTKQVDIDRAESLFKSMASQWLRTSIPSGREISVEGKGGKIVKLELSTEKRRIKDEDPTPIP